MAQKMLTTNDIQLTTKLIKDTFTEGETYTFAKICKALSIPNPKGTQREALKKELSRFIDYTQEGRNYTFNKIYARAKPKQPNKLRNDTKYVKYIEYLLMSLLYNNKENYTLLLTRKELWERLSFANADYFFYSRHKNAKQELYDEHHNEISYDLKLAHIYSFYKLTYNKFYKILADSLRSLERRSFIAVTPIYTIGDDLRNMREATDEEVKKWLKSRRKIMLKYGVEEFWQANKNLSPNEYDDMIDDLNKVQSKEMGYRYMVPKLKIIYHSYSMKEALKRDEEKIKEFRNELNTAIQNSIDTKLLKTIKEIKNKTTFGSPSQTMKDSVKEAEMHLLLSEFLINLSSKKERDLMI